jgi:hypothetical protein
MERIDITMKDVFISWTGKDVEIKNQIAERLRENGIEPLLSDDHCQGDFVEWSREAATSAHIFMSVISEDALMSKGMKWELEELDKKLCSDEGKFWKSAFVPVCKNLDVFNSYKEKFSSNGRNMLENDSAIVMQFDENKKLTEKCLKEIFDKTAERIISHMHNYYCE